MSGIQNIQGEMQSFKNIYNIQKCLTKIYQYLCNKVIVII